MSEKTLTNGPAAAAILSSAIGCFILGVLTFWADVSKPFGKLLNFYNPTGPLSGVTTLGIAAWLTAWIILAALWGKKTVAIAKVNVTAYVLLGLSVLLSFPPFADLLMGK